MIEKDDSRWLMYTPRRETTTTEVHPTRPWTLISRESVSENSRKRAEEEPPSGWPWRWGTMMVDGGGSCWGSQEERVEGQGRVRRRGFAGCEKLVGVKGDPGKREVEDDGVVDSVGERVVERLTSSNVGELFAVGPERVKVVVAMAWIGVFFFAMKR